MRSYRVLLRGLRPPATTTRFWVLSEALVGTSAHVCEACGFVQIHADTEKLKKLQPADTAQT